MHFRKIATWLTLSATAATPLAIAQNPTILQGNYISNVFGNSNFVLNPNAQTNVANVTNATRSTTTPLVATSEFNLSLASGANATWTLRAFDAGMKGQNCEARFSYRGFATATTKAELVQNSLVVASLTLTPTTDPRIASINFPCGDLAHLTTFRIAQTTAAMTGTNEIGGVYVGLATNMANVAQAEFVGSLSYQDNGACQWGRAGTGATFGNFAADTDCPINQVTGVCADAGKIPGMTCNLNKPGRYEVIVQQRSRQSGVSAATNLYRIHDGTTGGPTSVMYQAPLIAGYDAIQTQTLTASFEYTTAATKTFQVQASTGVGNTSYIYGNETNPVWEMKIYRFPLSSELVVKPETQNVFGGVVYTNQTQSLFSGTAEPTAFSPYTNATWNQPTLLKGKASVTTTNSGNDLGFSVANLPVGNYKLDVSGLLNSSVGAGTTTGTATICNFKLVETTTSTDIARQAHQDQQYGTSVGNESRNYVNAFTGIFTNTSLATRNFRLEAQKHFDTTTGNIGGCQAFSAISAGNNSNIAIIITPLDQPSNSALYVEGPVKAAATGAAIASGYQGETKTSSCTARVSASTTLNTYTDLSGDGVGGLAAITLDPGVWIITANLPQGYINWSSGVATAGWGDLAIREGSNIIELQAFAFAGDFGTTWNAASTDVGGAGIHTIVNVTSTKTYKLSMAPKAFSGSPVFGTFQAFCDVNAAKIRATRLN